MAIEELPSAPHAHLPQSESGATERPTPHIVRGLLKSLRQFTTEMLRKAPNRPAQSLDALRGPLKGRARIGEGYKSADEVFQHPPQPLFTNIFDRLRQHLLWTSSKLERNEMLVFFTGGVWEKTKAVRERAREEGSELELFDRKYPHPASPEYPLTPARVDNTHTIDDLMRCTKVTMTEGLRAWKEEEKGSLAYNRYARLIQEGAKNGFIRAETPYEAVGAGIVTAADTIWCLLEVIPRVYGVQNGKLPSQEQVEAIASHCLPLIVQIAAGNQSRSIALLDALKGNPSLSDPASGHNEFNPDFFTLVKNSHGEYTLKLKNKALRLRARDGIRILKRKVVGETTGCPFIQAKGANGKTAAMKELYEWCLDIAKKAYFPTLGLPA